MKEYLSGITLRRVLATVFGVILCAIAIGFFKFASYGVDPFQSLMSGLDLMIPISFGTLYMIVNALLLIFSLVFDRHYIGLGTLINLLLLGYIAEYIMNLLFEVMPYTLTVRVVCLVIGIVMICISSAFYMTADLGVSTYDAIALVMADKWHVASFKVCRVCSDLVCVILGAGLFLLAGGALSDITTIIGIGTIITAFFMGPLIAFFNKYLARPIVLKESK